MRGRVTRLSTTVKNEQDCESFVFFAKSIAIDPFDQKPLYLIHHIHHMHSGIGVFHPNGFVSLDTIVMAAQSPAQRNHILRLFT